MLFNVKTKIHSEINNDTFKKKGRTKFIWMEYGIQTKC